MEFNNSSTNQQLCMTEVKYAVFCVQVILGVTGILGNALVCVTIAKAKFMHNVTNFLIAHMAVADILVCVSLVIFQERYVEDASNDDAKQEMFCKFFHGKRLMWLSCDLSLLSMVCVTVERYLGIVHPLKYPRLVTKTRVGIMIAVVWCIAIIAKIPHLTSQAFNSDTKQCFTSGISDTSIALVSVVSLLEFYVPAAIILWCYRKILISLRKSAENQQRENNHAPANELLTACRRVIKVLLTVILLYFVIWVPVYLFFMVGLFKPNLSLVAHNILIALQPTIASVNSVVNPFIYAFKYKEFQRGLRFHVFPFCRRRRRVAAAVSIETIR
ncbi:neuropeptide Y receptor type 6-like [Patiria miniata]|uniref:G-protein coupled receptors family 1 profile domain-containing protein n=1 Tax=Patiria miniata TaxID=46514 RepID=A0A914A5M5_PATMI|nr:neuropeptide Y receptor type 6-like [Patiria miniata]